jgi:hypothetical protein
LKLARGGFFLCRMHLPKGEGPKSAGTMDTHLDPTFAISDVLRKQTM